MISCKLRTHIEELGRILDRGYRRIEGLLTCCGTSSFKVYAAGKIREGVGDRMLLFPNDGWLAMTARCNRCGRFIPVFSGNTAEDTWADTEVRGESVLCHRCKGRDFSVEVCYEYPEGSGPIARTDRKLTGIWVTLLCRSCGLRHKNFIDVEA